MGTNDSNAKGMKKTSDSDVQQRHTSDSDSVEAQVGGLNCGWHVFTLITESLCLIIGLFS